MRLSALVYAAGLALGLSACGVPEDDSELPGDPLVQDGTGADDKADQGAIPLQTLPVALPDDSTAEMRRTFISAGSFRNVFGTVAPEMDFSRRWVVLYSAGQKRTGGYRATVERVSLSSSGLTLKVVTRLRAPGPGCPVSFGLSRPHHIVSFPRPAVTPRYVTYYHITETAPPCD